MDFNKFLEALGGKRKLIFLSQEVSHKYRGETIKIIFDQYYKHITLKIPFQGNLTASAVKDDYSDDVTMESSSEDLISLPEVRKILNELFEEHFISLEIRKPYIRLKIDVRDIIKEGNYGVVRKICDTLFRLRDAITPYSEALPETYSRKGFYLIYAIPIVATILQVFIGFYLRYLARNEFSTLGLPLLAVVYALPVVVLYVLWAVRYLKRMGLSLIYKIYVIAIGWIWLLAFILPITAVNGYFDSSAEREHDFTITGKYTRLSKNSSTYYIILGNEKDKICDAYPALCGIVRKRIPVKRAEYDKVIPGKSKVKIYLKDGILGIKWYNRYMVY